MSKASSQTLFIVLVMLGVPTFCCLSSVAIALASPERFLGPKAGPNDGGYEMVLFFEVVPLAAIVSSAVGLIVAGIFSFLYVLFRKK